MASKHIQSSPAVAPEFKLIKEVTEAAEVGPFTTKKHGVNMGSYNYALVDIKAEGNANPNVAVFFWSEASQAFVQDNPPLTKAGVGVNVGYQFEVACRGRIMFIQVTGGVGAGQKATISVAGYELDHTL